MRLNRLQLRRLVEAEVDKMRLPKGPNSRDDAEEFQVNESPRYGVRYATDQAVKKKVYDALHAWFRANMPPGVDQDDVLWLTQRFVDDVIDPNLEKYLKLWNTSSF